VADTYSWLHSGHRSHPSSSIIRFGSLQEGTGQSISSGHRGHSGQNRHPFLSLFFSGLSQSMAGQSGFGHSGSSTQTLHLGQPSESFSMCVLVQFDGSSSHSGSGHGGGGGGGGHTGHVRHPFSSVIGSGFSQTTSEQLGGRHSLSQTSHPSQPGTISTMCDLMQFSGKGPHIGHGGGGGVVGGHTGHAGHPLSSVIGSGFSQNTAGHISLGHFGSSNLTQTLQFGQPRRCSVGTDLIQLGGSAWHL